MIPAGESRFLPEEISDIDGKTEVYSLEQEFAKTKKNKNWKLYLFIVGFVAIVVGGAWLFTKYLEWKSRDVPVSIKEFDDLRLKEVIESARKRGTNIDVMRINLQMLEIEMMKDVLLARKSFREKETEIVAQNISDEEMDERIALLRRDEEQKVKAIQADYRRRIAIQRAAIDTLEAERAKEEEQVRKQQGEGLTNAERLQALNIKAIKEKQQSGLETIRKYYDQYVQFVTMTYNPKFTGGGVKTVMDSAGSDLLSRPSFLKEYNAYLGESGYPSEDFQRLRKKIADFGFLMKRLSRIPFQNSVPPALSALDGLAGSITKEYESLWASLVEALKKKDAIIKEKDATIARKVQQNAQLMYPYEFMSQYKKEQGYIADPRNPEKILVYVSKAVTVTDGMTATVMSGERKIGTVRFFRDEDGMVWAKLVSLEKRRQLEPTHRLVFEKK